MGMVKEAKEARVVKEVKEVKEVHKRYTKEAEESKTIRVLNEILTQFEMNITEANMGEPDALDAEESNRESVEALKHAIGLELRELGSEWVKLSDGFPKEAGNYWVAMRHLDGSISVEKERFTFNELTISAWKEVVVAWQPYYYPALYIEV